MRLMELCVLQPPQRNTWQVWGGRGGGGGGGGGWRFIGRQTIYTSKHYMTIPSMGTSTGVFEALTGGSNTSKPSGMNWLAPGRCRSVETSLSSDQ